MKYFKYSLNSPSSRIRYPKVRIPVLGWIYSPQAKIRSVRVSCNGETLGETANFFERFDLLSALSLRKNPKLGFRILASVSGLNVTNNRAELVISARLENDDRYRDFCSRAVRFHPVDIPAERSYGHLASPDMTTVLHRENIYGSGPSSPVASDECVDLILQYLDPSEPLLDVGCGIGAYGARLIDKRFDWTGVETKESDCAVLEQKRLPHRKVEAGKNCRSRDGAFGNAICIEVLEHVEEMDMFLSEIARVTRKRTLFSVPNVEIIPMLQPYGVVPWHLLEATHVNFFNRYNLKSVLERYFRRVEVIDYGVLPIFSIEGCELPFHLFAIADK